MDVQDCVFEVGELYLFSADSPECDPENSLWGVFDTFDEQNNLWLEVMTFELDCFSCYCILPPGYKYVRLAKNCAIFSFAMGVGRTLLR